MFFYDIVPALAVQNERAVFQRNVPPARCDIKFALPIYEPDHKPFRVPYTMVIAPSLLKQHTDKCNEGWRRILNPTFSPACSGSRDAMSNTDFSIKRLTNPSGVMAAYAPLMHDWLPFLAALLTWTTRCPPSASIAEADRRMLLGHGWHTLFLFHYVCQFRRHQGSRLHA